MDRYEKNHFKKIIKESLNYSEATRKLGLPNFYGNRQTVKRYIKLYNIDILHFDFKPNYKNRVQNIRNKIPTKEILVENSTYASTNHLKKRLYKEGLKLPICELCGQDEIWNGKKMSLILDHKNGISNDNRIGNLRIVCSNCNATLDTHGGKNIKSKPIASTYTKEKHICKCGNKKTINSVECVQCSHITQRKVKRPDIEILKKEINELGYVGTGKKYGVSDNAIRKWLK